MLEITGERTVPGVPTENYWFARHVAAYAFAAERCLGLRVVDAGCGEGYGSALLAEQAATALGVDRAVDVVAHAGASHPTAVFATADVSALPLDDAGVDVVVSLQVVEHLPDLGRALDEARRVLRPGGRFICSTPNRLTFTPTADAPVNPFHVRELDPGELAVLLTARFAEVELLGVHHGARLRAVERAARQPFPQLLLASPPQDWPAWLRRAVAAVRPSDFVVRPEAVEDSLDLLAVAIRLQRRQPSRRGGPSLDGCDSGEK